MLDKIPFVTSERALVQMAYNDCVYAWLLLNSHYNEIESHNYIYKADFTQSMIADDVNLTRQTVSKRLKALINQSQEDGNVVLIKEYKDYYILPNFKPFQYLDGETTLNLLRLPFKKEIEEIIKVYAWLLEEKQVKEKEGKSLMISEREILRAFNHSEGNKQAYNRIKGILTVLQGAGIVKFRTLSPQKNDKGQFYGKSFQIYEVNKKADREWLDRNKKQEEIK